MVAVLAAATKAGDRFASNFELPGSDSQQATDLLKESFPAQAGDAAIIVFSTSGPDVTRTAEGADAPAALKKIARFPHVSRVESPFGTAGAQRVTADRTVAYATVQFDQRSFELPVDAIERVRDGAEAIAAPGLEVVAGGQPISTIEQQRQSSSEIVGLGAAVIVLLLTFGSAAAMGLPVITALAGLGSGLGLVTLATHVFDIPEFAPQVAAMIGLGVGIDYALFIVSRFRHELYLGREPADAAVHAMDTSGRAVMFAGTAVILALMGMFLLGVTFVRGLAISASITVLLVMLASLTLLPTLLRTIGRRIDRLRVPGIGLRDVDDESGGWWRWSRVVQRHPAAVAVTATAGLLLLIVPTLDLRLGSSDDGSDPPGSSTRKAYDELAQGFGPGFNGPFQVVVDLRGERGAAVLGPLRRRMIEDPDVASVGRPLVAPGGGVALLTAVPRSSPQSEKTAALLERLRNEIAPEFERGRARVHVGGLTAVFDDLATTLADKLPLFIGSVIVLAALILAAVFRSVLVPLKAVAVSLLSIAAAFGVIVAIFQWGWLSEVIGIDRTGPIESFLPVMLFAIVFGLSMDYEIFLISRIHEEWIRHGDASRAVARGLAITGRVITAAAAIMIAVFGSFALGDQRILKLFGIGLAAAVFIDAVIIRSLLVPAVMELLGRGAWWFPNWLDRILPRLAVEPHDRPLVDDGLGPPALPDAGLPAGRRRR